MGQYPPPGATAMPMCFAVHVVRKAVPGASGCMPKTCRGCLVCGVGLLLALGLELPLFGRPGVYIRCLVCCGCVCMCTLLIGAGGCELCVPCICMLGRGDSRAHLFCAAPLCMPAS
jgi:hypothetical protein